MHVLAYVYVPMYVQMIPSRSTSEKTVHSEYHLTFLLKQDIPRILILFIFFTLLASIYDIDLAWH